MSDTMTEEERKLLKEFEDMLAEDNEDFGYFDPVIETEEPPPIPKEDIVKAEAQRKCEHAEWKKVFYTQTKAYKMCIACKKDLGDA